MVFSRRFPIEWFLKASFETVQYVLDNGLQRLLILLTAVVSSELTASLRVPPGFTRRFSQCFSNPTQGATLDLVVWASGHHVQDASRSLCRDLQAEKRAGMWLDELVRLRNRLYHPKEETPEQIEESLHAALERIPDPLRRALVEIIDATEAYWISGDERISLAPFVFGHNGQPVVFTGTDPQGQIQFPIENQDMKERFRRLWFEWQVMDQALDEATPESFHAKVKRTQSIHSGEAPRWLEEIRKPGFCAFLVSPDLIDGMLCHIPKVWPGASVLDLSPTRDKTVSQCIAATVGLAKAPSAKELLALVSDFNPCVIAVRTFAMTSREFLEVLYWLADALEIGSSNCIRFLIARTAAQLHVDDQKLSDRLPERLDQLLRRPSRAKPTGLEGYLWISYRSKHLVGLFGSRA